MGCQTSKINCLGDIGEAMQLVKNRQQGIPILIEAAIDPDVVSTIYEHKR